MSRYRIPAKDSKFDVHVGWDNPLQTFFAQVADPTKLDEEGEETYPLWIGGSPSECTDVEEIANAISEYADLPPNIKERLLQDYNERTEPTWLQKFAVRKFKEALNENKGD